MEICLGVLEGGAAILERRLRQQPLDQIHGVLVQSPHGLTVRVAFDASAGRVCSCSRDACELEGLGVGPRAVPISVGEENGSI